ncbi:MAG TPA: hypothetical protein P5230_01960 [Candidatus Magasanikbacteria bacterium]|nr:hypothetical protein [Candidatus Magasanikbacteria bacterium]
MDNLKEQGVCAACGKKPAKTKGVCRNCYQLIYFGYLKPPEEIKKLFSNFKKCLVSGCKLNGVSEGYCKAHYEDFEMDRPFRKIKRKHPIVEKQTNKGKICQAEGCDRPATSRGYCPAHYNQWLKSKKITPLKEKKKNGAKIKKQTPSYV